MLHDLGIAVSSCSFCIFLALKPELPSHTVEISHHAPVVQPIGNLREVHLKEERSFARHTFPNTETRTISLVFPGNKKERKSLVVGENRVDELARMLGGKTKSALEHAKELLRGANPQKSRENRSDELFAG